MKTILATAYAIHPEKGSEDGMGWNFTQQIARHNRVLVITRKNNRPAIEKRMEEAPEKHFKNMEFHYHDLPYYLRFWKRGSRGALLYFYLWQLTIPLFVRWNNLQFDLAHNLNFHNDWTPSLLWTLGKPFVWGPVGHHPKIPTNYLKLYGRKARFMDQLRWMAKQLFWTIDPLVKLSASKADHVLCMNSEAQKVLSLPDHRCSVTPSVASEPVAYKPTTKSNFLVLSVGRFVALKGFDLTIAAFARFVQQEQPNARLTLVGKGPEKHKLEALCNQLGIREQVDFIEWMPREELITHYRESSVFLFPSHEGAGMVVAEALSYGIPVVCLNNAGPGEFITEACGHKVNHQSYEATVIELANHLSTLYHNPAHRENLARGARKHFQEHFAWNCRGEQLRDIYQMVFERQEVRQAMPLSASTLSKSLS